MSIGSVRLAELGTHPLFLDAELDLQGEEDENEGEEDENERDEPAHRYYMLTFVWPASESRPQLGLEIVDSFRLIE
jgi:hypothetical protein